MFFKTAPITAALSSLMLLATAVPATAMEERTVNVVYKDLNLTDAKDVERLHWRIKSAAKKVCSPLPGAALRDIQDHRRCINAAVDTSRTAVVTLLAMAKSQRPFTQSDVNIVVTR